MIIDLRFMCMAVAIELTFRGSLQFCWWCFGELKLTSTIHKTSVYINKQHNSNHTEQDTLKEKRGTFWISDNARCTLSRVCLWPSFLHPFLAVGRQMFYSWGEMDLLESRGAGFFGQEAGF